MKKEIQYDSRMNELSFGKFKEKELDLFFSICYKMKNEGLNEVILDFKELKELSNYSNRNLERFIRDLENTYTKLLDIKIEINVSVGVKEKFVLFTKYRIDNNEKKITIKLNDEYNFILNDIGKFTKFDLIEFTNIKSSYAKNIFKLLKQFDNTESNNWYQIKLDKLKELLNIPVSYKMIDIDKRVLIPTLEQLNPVFLNLEIEKIKKGVKVDSLKFTWKSKKEKKENIIEVQPVKRKKSALGEKELQEHEKNIQELEIKNIPQEPIVELIKITKNDYEALYNDYLEQLGEKHNIYIRKSFDFINKAKYEIIENIDRTLKKIFTENDIDESLLVSKTGKKLVGTARKNKIEKLLDEMNK